MSIESHKLYLPSFANIRVQGRLDLKNYKLSCLELSVIQQRSHSLGF